MPIPWTKDLSVNVEEIDKQHQAFLGILNSLYTVLNSSSANAEIRAILQQLKSYKEFHFATEEKYFAMFNYELAEQHKEEHRKLSAKIEEFIKRFEVEGDKVLIDLVDFLEDWLVDHLGNQDKKYSQCFNEHGLL
jgi:hemerythrin